MAATKLTAQDKRDFEKFTKYLVYKCIQIIVQSRLGERVKTQSRPFSTGSDWFNLAIKDLPEVLAECKKVVTTGTLSVGQNVCLEISLKTMEGETMILETWWLNATDQTDPNARISYTVYNRMNVLLKSLFCTTRATPAYKLSRKQGPDSYVVCYRIYTSEPEMLCLGEAYHIAKVGVVPSPLGTLNLSVAYRTKMLISPHTSLRDFTADLKDDHFKSETSPKRSIDMPKPCYMVNRDISQAAAAAEDGYIFGESEYCATSFSTSPVDGFYLGQSPPDRQLIRRTSTDTMIKKSSSSDLFPNKVYSDTSRPSADNLHIIKEVHTNGINGIHTINEKEGSYGDQPNKTQVSSDIKEIGAFVSDGESDSDETDSKSPLKNHYTDSGELPLVKMVCEMTSLDNNANTHQHKKTAVINTLDITNGEVNPTNYTNGGVLPQNGTQNINNNEFIQQRNGGSPICKQKTGARKQSGAANLSELSERLRRISGESNKSESSHVSGMDEYVVVDGKNALTEIDDNPELGQFYRECKLPPDLAMFTDPSMEEASVQDMYNSITDQLQKFEIQAQDFDDFVNSLSVGEST